MSSIPGLPILELKLPALMSLMGEGVLYRSVKRLAHVTNAVKRPSLRQVTTGSRQIGRAKVWSCKLTAGASG